MAEEVKQDEQVIAGKILKEEKKQSRKEGIQSIALVVMAVCAVIITISVVTLIANVTQKLNAIYTKADTAITTLNEVANGIHEADLPGMAEQIKSLTENATSGISTTMEKIDSIDIESLNDSIERLDSATEAFSNTVQGMGSIFG
ncbi:MAG: hypothetical protein J6127_06740 [Clostridiales bacterium]|nr:hypothetical protein [Clostridiales bacterium]